MDFYKREYIQEVEVEVGGVITLLQVRGDTATRKTVILINKYDDKLYGRVVDTEDVIEFSPENIVEYHNDDDLIYYKYSVDYEKYAAVLTSYDDEQ